MFGQHLKSCRYVLHLAVFPFLIAMVVQQMVSVSSNLREEELEVVSVLTLALLPLLLVSVKPFKACAVANVLLLI